MKNPFYKIYNAITLKDLKEEIHCLRNDVEGIQRSIEAQTMAVERLQAIITGFFETES